MVLFTEGILSKSQDIFSSEDTPKTEPDLLKTPYSDICGRPVIMNPLVAHGDPTSRGAFPWLVAIFVLNNTVPKFRCSGSLVSGKHVVTGE